jgi:hypothetical protein
VNVGGTLTIENCVLTDNSVNSEGGFASNVGGAVASWDGRLRIEDTLLAGNRAQGAGDAIALIGGRGAIVNSIIRDNELSIGISSAGCRAMVCSRRIQVACLSTTMTQETAP